MKGKNRTIDLNNIHDEEQGRVMERIEKDGVCPFCLENFTKYHKKPILKEGKYWLLTENEWPYKNTRVHMLAVHKEHIESIAQMKTEAFAELGELFKWVVEEYAVAGGGLFMRFGETKYTGGSVTHLHAQILQADIDSPGYEKLKVRLG